MATVNEFNSQTTLLSAVTGTGAGDTVVVKFGNQRTFQAVVAGTGAVTATVLVQASNDGTNWETRMTITLSGTTSDSDGGPLEESWAYYRGNVTAISGTGAAVTLTMRA